MNIPLRQFARLIAVALAVVTLGAAPAIAAEAGSEEEFEQLMALLTQRLGLSDYQVEVIRPRVREHLEAVRALFAGYRYGGAGSIPSLLQEFQELRDDLRADLDVELDDQQMLGLEKLREEIDATIRDTIVGYRLEMLREKLGLSAEQESAIRPILAENFDERQKLMSLHTDAAGGGARLQRNLGPEIDQADNRMEQKLQGVLTKHQMEAYSAWIAAERQSLRQQEAVSQ